jgi:prepilin-type N-terminal cleavage/methylation domain-containing protein
MKTHNCSVSGARADESYRRRSSVEHGFTILELLIATVVFLVIAGAALMLFRTEQPLLNRQQNFAALNISMRNSVAQMQLDVENAGTGYYPGTNIPDWPIGVTITNQTPASACNNSTTFTYSSTCFDTLNIITTDPSTPPAHPTNSTLSLLSARVAAVVPVGG